MTRFMVTLRFEADVRSEAAARRFVSDRLLTAGYHTEILAISHDRQVPESSDELVDGLVFPTEAAAFDWIRAAAWGQDNPQRLIGTPQREEAGWTIRLWGD